VKIYTRAGDKGETGLFFGGRVPKNDPRCEAYGSVDHVVSAMGTARAFCKDEKVKRIIIDIQNQLFTVGAELATLPENYDTMKDAYKIIVPEMVIELEQLIDELDSEVKLPPSFILPGASPGSAVLDLARTALREAERRILDVEELGQLVNRQIIPYVNRLSDLLFMLARYEDRDLPDELITGQKINE
tara:strand:+ start:618 stop:1181 length:564 start_codon:yes stop_codon:yes gene_type:complete